MKNYKTVIVIFILKNKLKLIINVTFAPVFKKNHHSIYAKTKFSLK